MKMNRKIKQAIREEVSRIICNNLYVAKRATLKWILNRFEGRNITPSLDGLITLSGDCSAILPPNPYNSDTRKMYADLGLDGVMTYQQFIFELPRLWYTTLYRLLCEWEDEFSEDVETAY